MINSSVMSKYFGIVIGAVAILLGLKGLVVWRGDLLAVVRGSLPAVFVLGGAIAVIAGLSEIKDEISSKRSGK
jgi:hypothetical protein